MKDTDNRDSLAPRPVIEADVAAAIAHGEVLVHHTPCGDFEIKTPRSWYLIERARLESTDDLVPWLLHLSGKIWFTRQHVRELIGAFADATGFRRDGLIA